MKSPQRRLVILCVCERWDHRIIRELVPALATHTQRRSPRGGDCTPHSHTMGPDCRTEFPQYCGRLGVELSAAGLMDRPRSTKHRSRPPVTGRWHRGANRLAGDARGLHDVLLRPWPMNSKTCMTPLRHHVAFPLIIKLSQSGDSCDDCQLTRRVPDTHVGGILCWSC